MYANYADENGLLTYAQLHKNALDARLLQEVQSRMNDVTLAEQRLITETIEEFAFALLVFCCVLCCFVVVV